MLLVEGFQKFAGIPFGISRIFESLIPQQISANRRKNRSIQVQRRCKMHNTLKRITKKLKKLEEITEEHQEVIDAIRVILEALQVTQTEGIAMTGDDEKALNALEIIVNYMVKDSSIT